MKRHPVEIALRYLFKLGRGRRPPHLKRWPQLGRLRIGRLPIRPGLGHALLLLALAALALTSCGPAPERPPARWVGGASAPEVRAALSPDEERTLTARGEERVQQLANRWAERTPASDDHGVIISGLEEAQRWLEQSSIPSPYLEHAGRLLHEVRADRDQRREELRFSYEQARRTHDREGMALALSQLETLHPDPADPTHRWVQRRMAEWEASQGGRP